MAERAKEEVLLNEGDAYFHRNSPAQLDEKEPAAGCKLFGEFLETNMWLKKSGKQRILEIGCCYGNNLMHLCSRYGFEGYGIEPSAEAVAYGQSLIKDEQGCRISLSQGTSDALSFADDYFDIVMLGFCVFWVDRKYIQKTVSEADRVLKTGGILVSWDFDTKIPYRRPNIHNEHVPTYKYDIARLFLGNPQYSLIEKRSFSHAGYGFDMQMQERCALNVLYKETIEDAYIYCM